MTETLSKDLAGLPTMEAPLGDDTGCDWVPLHMVRALLAQHAQSTVEWTTSATEPSEKIFVTLADGRRIPYVPQHAVAEPQTLGQRMGTGAPAVLLQKIEAILGRCVFDQSDSLTYDEGVKLVRDLVAPAHAVAEPSGYAYRYHDGIRFNHGQEVNGGRPIEAIPYYFGVPPAAHAAEQPKLTEEQRKILNGLLECVSRMRWQIARLPNNVRDETFERDLEQLMKAAHEGEALLAAPVAPPPLRPTCIDGCSSAVGQPAKHMQMCPNYGHPYLVVRLGPPPLAPGEQPPQVTHNVNPETDRCGWREVRSAFGLSRIVGRPSSRQGRRNANDA